VTLAASLAGAAWISANMSSYWRYRAALSRPADTQWALLRRYLRDNAGTAFGHAHGFARIRSIDEYQANVPLASYADLSPWIDDISRGSQHVLTRARVRSMGVSSGSVAAAKRIPYTRQLQQEFRRAIAPWVADLYRSRPRLALGSSYWSITPVARDPGDARGAIPVGFEEDSEYVGAAWKRLVDATLAVPGAVRFIRDMESFRYVTLLFLLKRRDLSLISVWHPTFLTLLFEAMVPWWDMLIHDTRRGTIRAPALLPADLARVLGSFVRPNPGRARELSALGPRDYAAIWPHLRLVSCWAEGHAGLHAHELKRMLPDVQVQPKGLMATEAVVTLPFRGLTPLAVRSHFFEFLRDGRALLSHQIVPGDVHSVVVTTAGGLYRYRLEDRVQVNGFVGATPSLTFLGKEDHVSDLCGEKLNEAFVAGELRRTWTQLGVLPRFAMIAPDQSRSPARYTLYLEMDADPPIDLDRLVDERLACNPHYRYCRTLGQLGQLRLFRGSSAMFPLYVERCRALGQRVGDIKPLALSRYAGWSAAFLGHYQGE
jgi:hypothetical protein